MEKMTKSHFGKLIDLSNQECRCCLAVANWNLSSNRTGRILYALGNLRTVQGKLSQSYSCHQQAYEQFRSTIGNRNHRTANIEHKIAEHLIRLKQNEEAM